MKKKKFGIIGVCLLLATALSVIVSISLITSSKDKATNLYTDYGAVEKTETYEDIRNGNVSGAIVDDGIMYYKTLDGTMKSVSYDDSMSVLKVDGLLTLPEVTKADTPVLIIAFAVLGIIFCFIAFFFIVSTTNVEKITKKLQDNRQLTGPKKGNIIKKTKPNVHFDDVKGIDSIKDEVKATIDCLINPAYLEIGAKPRKGVILCGAPGTGKTLLAKAMAGEAHVPFLSVNASDFMEMYVGVGAARIRDLYDEAKKSAPCIVFIDEIDAIGGARGSSQNGERDQTIDALLTALDGFDGTEGILTICATNRLDMLDSALTRPGRFDLTLTVNAPDREGRLDILKHHSKGKKLSMDVNLADVAKRTLGFTGAALEALMNESAMEAVQKHHKVIMPEDIDNAFFKIIMKGTKKRRKGDSADALVQQTNKIVAWHEAGHALTAKLLTDNDVPMVTIVGSTSGAEGVTMNAPKESPLRSKREILAEIQVDYAGRAAEQILLGNEDDITTGASSDIRHASVLIRDYLSIYGMGSQGLLNFSVFSENAEKQIDEASVIAHELYNKVLMTLNANKETLERIAQALIENETIDEDQLNYLIYGEAETEEEKLIPATVCTED